MDIVQVIRNNAKIFSNMMSLGLLQAANYIIPIAVIPFVVRALGVDAIGKVSYAQNIIMYFIIFVTYGFEYSATKEIAIHRENHEALRTIFWSVIRGKCLIFASAVVIFALLSLCWGKVQTDLPLYLCVFSITIGYTLFPTWFFQGIEDMTSMSVINFLIKLFGTGLTVFFVKSPEDYLIFAAMPAISYAGFGLLSLLYVVKHYDLNPPRRDNQETIQQLKMGFPIFLNCMFSTLYTIANLTILGIFANDHEVGIYSGAHKIITAIMMLSSMPINLAIYPSISRERAKSVENGWHYLKKMLCYVSIASLGVCAVTFIAAPLLVKLLLGGAFAEAIPILRILSVIPPLVIMASMFTIQGLYAMGYQKYAPFIGFSIGIACVTISYTIIPIYGIIGAVVAWIAAEIMEIIISGSILTFKMRQIKRKGNHTASN